MVWSQMKHYCRRQNIYTNKSSKVLDLIRKVCNTKILPKYWESFASHVLKKEEKFRKTHHIVDSEIETIIKYCPSSVSDSDSNVEQ